MSPHLIIILMLSTSTLLIMMLFAVRKKAKKKQQTIPLTVSPTSMPDLSTLDLSALRQDSSLDPVPEKTISSPHAGLSELVSRYRFFQGKNLQLFKEFVEQKDWTQIEQLIREKFQAQGKADAPQLAKSTLQKLLQS